jgi:hypothetical protein
MILLLECVECKHGDDVSAAAVVDCWGLPPKLYPINEQSTYHIYMPVLDRELPSLLYQQGVYAQLS